MEMDERLVMTLPWSCCQFFSEFIDRLRCDESQTVARVNLVP